MELLAFSILPQQPKVQLEKRGKKFPLSSHRDKEELELTSILVINF